MDRFGAGERQGGGEGLAWVKADAYDAGMDEHENELSRLVDQLNRAATASKAGEKRSIDQLVGHAVESHASDIILVAGSPATMRVNGALTADAGPRRSAPCCCHC